MANIKELRGRIKSVGSIAQITRAMEMVASMKLRKVQAKALAHRPYASEIRMLGRSLATGVAGEVELPLLRRREVRTVGVFLITSDRGLCGAYNSNVLARVHDFADRTKAAGKGVKFFVYGRKGYTYLFRRKFEIERFFVDPPLDKMDYLSAREVVQALVEAFEGGTVDEVRVFHTAFLSTARFEPTDVEFLPVPSLETMTDGESAGTRDVYLIEPDHASLLNVLVPKYLETVVYDAMLQSLAAEYASRRIAMKGATDAASRMRTELRRVYNRARQESITKELLDIVGGANAVS
jgi:F-type H+-transporting ATPase subunit gamma